jgi:hypothetical protein
MSSVHAAAVSADALVEVCAAFSRAHAHIGAHAQGAATAAWGLWASALLQRVQSASADAEGLVGEMCACVRADHSLREQRTDVVRALAELLARLGRAAAAAALRGSTLPIKGSCGSALALALAHVQTMHGAHRPPAAPCTAHQPRRLLPHCTRAVSGLATRLGPADRSFDGCFGAGCAEASGANGLTIDALTLEAQLHAAQADDEGWRSAVRCLK